MTSFPDGFMSKSSEHQAANPAGTSKQVYVTGWASTVKQEIIDDCKLRKTQVTKNHAIFFNTFRF